MMTMKQFITMLVYSSCMVLGPQLAKAQFLSVPLYFGTTNSVKNETGIILNGTALQPGDLVQLLRADDGIYPPTTNGAPHIFNPVLGETRIGVGTDPSAGAIGKFSSSVTINRYQVTPMFVRVFNRHTKEDSSFYCNSQIYSNSVITYGVFIANVDKTCIELDPGDDDNDDLSNSWEKALGTDRANPDSDGDGFTDGSENLAGTGALDDNDFLQLAEVRLVSGTDLNIIWDSVSNKFYQVEYSADIVTGPATFISYGSIIQATGSQSSITIPDGTALPNPAFRIRLITP